MKKQSSADLNIGPFNIKTNRIRKSISEKECTVLEINLEYPEITPDNTDFSNTFNSFYNSIAKNYLEFCEKKIIKKICRNKTANTSGKAFGEIMKFFITRNCDKYLSVVTEISHFNGYFTEKTRFSCVWEKTSSRIMPYSYFLDMEGLNVRDIRKKVRDAIMSELESGSLQFGYTEDNIKRYASRVSPENYFLTESGIAFWFPPGTLAPKSEGFPTFVIKSNFLHCDNN